MGLPPNRNARLAIGRAKVLSARARSYPVIFFSSENEKGGSVPKSVLHVAVSKPPASIASVWERQAGRLFAEFWLSGKPRHLRAFCVHVEAMRSYAVRRTRIEDQLSNEGQAI